MRMVSPEGPGDHFRAECDGEKIVPENGANMDSFCSRCGNGVRCAAKAFFQPVTTLRTIFQVALKIRGFGNA
jgi:diaminopimelate epimerase